MAPAVSQPGFLDQPKTDHHVQIMVLCIVLGIVVVAAWLYAVLASPSTVTVTTQPPAPAAIDPMAQERARIMSVLRTAVPPSASDVTSALKQIAAKKATVTSAQKQGALAQIRAAQ